MSDRERIRILTSALVEVVKETEGRTFGRPSYDPTLDHLHDVAKGALAELGFDVEWAPFVADLMDTELPRVRTAEHGEGA